MVKVKQNSKKKTEIKKEHLAKEKRAHFKNIVSCAKKHIRKLKPKCKKVAIDLAIAAAKDVASNLPVDVPRIIPIPKTGGFLPLVPIFAGLSAAGSLAGGAAGIAKAIHNIKTARKRLEELKRHNLKMETLVIGKGIKLKQCRDGLGLFTKRTKN